jgi:hypothetical protein
MLFSSIKGSPNTTTILMHLFVNSPTIKDAILTKLRNRKTSISKPYISSSSVHPRIPMASDDKQNGLKGMVKDVIDQILPSSQVELTDIKEEIWQDLSALYYKYEDEDQKRAFREVMYDISDRIQEGKWDSVYKSIERLTRN